MHNLIQNLFTLSEEELCKTLISTEHEDEVISILDEQGLTIDREDIWLPLGDNPGNFSTIANQQADASAALIEKIVNSIDAVLIAECYKNGIDPESDDAPRSMSAAVDKFLGVTDGRLDYISPIEQTNLAERIRFMVTGDKELPCINIIDYGDGQSPSGFKDTFLSTTRSSPKIRIPFVQGKFNAGSTGSLQFCGKHNVQLILSKKNPHCPLASDNDSYDEWGFTIVRRKRPTNKGDRSSIFVYLAPNGQIPRFTANELDLLPTKSSVNKPGTPYKKPLSSGSFIKLYNYRWKGKSIATTEGRRNLEKFLQAPCLPFRIHETRPYKANYYDTTVIGVLNKIQGDIVDDNSGDLETGFPADLLMSIPEIGTLKLKIVVWKDTVKSRTVPTGVFFLVNGQVHGDAGVDFIKRRTKFDYISNHLYVAVDCTDTDRDFHEDAFMPSRDRLRDNELARLMKEMIAAELKDHPGLKEINAYRKQKLREAALKNNDDVVNIFNELVKSDPSLAAVLGLGGHIQGGVGPGEIKKFEGRKFPTYFRIASEPIDGLVKKCPVNRTISVVFETDADNDYFRRPNEPGELEIAPSIDLIESSRLWNGRFNVRFRVPWNAKVDDEYDVIINVTDFENIARPFKCKFKLIATERTHDIKTKSGKKNPPVNPISDNPKIKIPAVNLPDPIAVSKKDWDLYGFKSSTDAFLIKDSDSGFDYYWNLDNKYLIHETSNKGSDVELIKQWFKWGLTIAALGLIKKQQDDAPNPDEGVNLDYISEACNGLAIVIIPIIRTLHDLPLSKL